MPEPRGRPRPDEPVGTAGPAVGGGGVLRDGGIGDVDFGAPPLGALEELTALLGPLDAESGWERYYGECPYVSRYTAVWGPLLVRFASGTTPLADRGQEHLTAWSLVGSPDVASDPRFTTPEGIGLGATRDDLVAAYGDRLVVDGAAFQVGPVRDAGPLAGEPLLRGFLDASGRVEQLGAGLSCDA